MNWFIVSLLFALALTAAVIYAFYVKGQSARILKGLDDMISSAMDGGFSESGYDESMRSRVENRFAGYIMAAETSFRGVREERERISSLISDISHQTRTPMANIRLYTQLLGEQGMDGKDSETACCLKALDSQTEKLQSLIEALVKTSRLESGLMELDVKACPLEDIVLRTVEQYRPRAAEKNISLRADTVPLQALCDARWTEEALCNLLDNAVKYTPEGGSIEVRMTAYEMFCRVDVSDTGEGISEEDQPRIFGRFYRGRKAADKPGVGIGLYLARRIISGDGGYIKLDSAPGKGSVFSVFLQRPDMPEM